MAYQKIISYGGSTITLTVTPKTGTVSTDDPTPTNTVTTDIDGSSEDVAGITNVQLQGYLEYMEVLARAQVDGVDAELNSLLGGLGYTLV